MARKPKAKSPEEIARERDEFVGRLCRWYCSTLFAVNELYDESWEMVTLSKAGGPLVGLLNNEALRGAVRGLDEAWSALSSNPPAVLGPYRMVFNV